MFDVSHLGRSRCMRNRPRLEDAAARWSGWCRRISSRSTGPGNATRNSPTTPASNPSTTYGREFGKAARIWPIRGDIEQAGAACGWCRMFLHQAGADCTVIHSGERHNLAPARKMQRMSGVSSARRSRSRAQNTRALARSGPSRNLLKPHLALCLRRISVADATESAGRPFRVIKSRRVRCLRVSGRLSFGDGILVPVSPAATSLEQDGREKRRQQDGQTPPQAIISKRGFVLAEKKNGSSVNSGAREARPGMTNGQREPDQPCAGNTTPRKYGALWNCRRIACAVEFSALGIDQLHRWW